MLVNSKNLAGTWESTKIRARTDTVDNWFSHHERSRSVGVRRVPPGWVEQGLHYALSEATRQPESRDGERREKDADKSVGFL
jgi:hypothetical protein